MNLWWRPSLLEAASMSTSEVEQKRCGDPPRRSWSSCPHHEHFASPGCTVVTSQVLAVQRRASRIGLWSTVMAAPPVSGVSISRIGWPAISVTTARVAGSPWRQTPSRKHALQPTRHSLWAPFQYVTVSQPAETLGFLTLFIHHNRTRCDGSEMFERRGIPGL
jgi:hypothetical protein